MCADREAITATLTSVSCCCFCYCYCSELVNNNIKAMIFSAVRCMCRKCRFVKCLQCGMLPESTFTSKLLIICRRSISRFLSDHYRVYDHLIHWTVYNSNISIIIVLHPCRCADKRGGNGFLFHFSQETFRPLHHPPTQYIQPATHE